MKRRQFIKTALAVGATLSVPSSRVLGANDDIRLGAIGMGSFVKIGGRGRRDVWDFHGIPGVRVVAISDCDTKNLGYVEDQFKKRNEKVKAYVDFRDLLEDPGIDAVTIATPNHWHSLMTIMACQAGKDVFVQKPASHNLFEGRKMVEAMRKYGRIVQTPQGFRSNDAGATEEAYEYVWQGNLGKILCVHGLNYSDRPSIGKVDGPRPIPRGCDYNLWCGPAPKKPLMREHLHYDWHWDWDTGNGALGAWGIHMMDSCRWALRKQEFPKRVISIGARLGYDDDGETPNTSITLLDYEHEPAPIIFEVRGLPKDHSYREGNNWSNAMDEYRGVRVGIIIQCEGGFVRDDLVSVAAYDNQGRQIRTFSRTRDTLNQNFINAVRTRRPDDLYSDALWRGISPAVCSIWPISRYASANRPVPTPSAKPFKRKRNCVNPSVGCRNTWRPIELTCRMSRSFWAQCSLWTRRRNGLSVSLTTRPTGLCLEPTASRSLCQKKSDRKLARIVSLGTNT